MTANRIPPLAWAFATGALLALGACGSNDDAAQPGAPASSTTTAAAAAAAVPMQPGSYAITSRIVSFDAPGVPEQQLSGLRQAMVGQGSERTVCLSAQAARGGLAGFAPQMADAPENCTFENVNAAPGRIASHAMCRQQGGTLELTTDGAVQGQEAAMQLDMVGSGFADPAKNMAMRMDVTARRTGAC